MKQVLRRLLGRYVSEEITSLPKRGFGVPLDDWLRGPLSTWAGELLDPALLAEDGVVSSTGLPSGADAKKKIMDVRNDKNHPYHDPRKPGHKEAVEEMNRLYELLHG